MKILYAILDTLANDLGPVVAHKHEAAAIRMFGDVLSATGSVPNAHPNDFALVRLGHLTELHQLVPDYALVMTGQTWLAAQQQDNNLKLEA